MHGHKIRKCQMKRQGKDSFRLPPVLAVLSVLSTKIAGTSPITSPLHCFSTSTSLATLVSVAFSVLAEPDAYQVA